MSRLQEIKSSIGSVKSTKKITRAYYLISASKSKRAKMQLEMVRPYFNRIAACISDIRAYANDIETPFITHFKNSEEKGNLYIVIAGDKGMAGAYNHNIVKMMDGKVNKEKDTVMVVGSMGRSKIARAGYNVEQDFKYQVMNPSVRRAKEIAEIVVERYLSAEYHEVYVIYTLMITPLKQTPISAKLLPLEANEHAVTHTVTDPRHTISYEPSPQEVFDHLVPHYIKGIIYGALVEAFTSEQNARMYAMENATKNADDLISKLTLNYNRARQAVITQEINEIVGGIPAD